ncbi:methyltransferase like 21e [Lepisosteus oculatus]
MSESPPTQLLKISRKHQNQEQEQQLRMTQPREGDSSLWNSDECCVLQSENREESPDDADLVSVITSRRFCPSVITTVPWEGYRFANYEIKIKESTDCYGAVPWPSALVLGHFLDANQDKYNLMDKNVIELGAGTGLVSIVASLLGAKVTATDLPEVLGNLQYNVSSNTKGRCRHTPRVTELSWGKDLEQNFPRSSCHYDYIMAADVVYSHPFLPELLATFDHLCRHDTVIFWAMRFRLEKENKFVDQFQRLFDLELIFDLPSLKIKLYRAMKKEKIMS